jgi:hypothetical protein
MYIKMNNCIFNICNYIITSKIKNINISQIIKEFHKYIPVDLLNSDILKYKIFQKLVLYNYCFTLDVDKLYDSEIKKINNFISNDNTKLYFKLNYNYIQFICWCRIYNKQNKNKIKIISLINRYNVPANSEVIYSI